MNKNLKYKVALLGPSTAGKTSILNFFVSNTFVEEQEPTVGAAFAAETLETDKGSVTLNIWDTAGQERFKSLVPKYARGAAAIIIVFDVSNIDSFKQACCLFNEHSKIYEKDVLWFMAANKIDCEISVDFKDVSNFVQNNNIHLFRTSAKTGECVKLLFQAVAEAIVHNTNVCFQEQLDSISISKTNKKPCCI